MFDNDGTKQTQSGSNNQQAGESIYNTFINENDIGFDLVEIEKIIEDLYEVSKSINTKQDFTIKRMEKIEDKNKINQMEKYFDTVMKQDIVYFNEILTVLRSNEEDFYERFKYIITTVRGAVLAIDNKEELTPSKINQILKIFYKQDWSFDKKIKASRLIYFMYFFCLIGKKKI